LVVVEDFNFDTPKTKDFQNILQALKVDGKKVLLLTGSHSSNVYKSGRNISKVKVLEAAKASTYDILNNQVLILQASAVNEISKSLEGEAVS
jgi:large subunit ribosomal protein L4